jgi:putative hemolysin
MNQWLLFLLLAILGSAFFSGCETAVISSNRFRQRAGSQGGNRLAALAEKLYQRPEHTLVVLLLGINLANVFASICALILTGMALDRLGLPLPDLSQDLVSSLWLSILVLIFGEILAKGVGRNYAVRISRLAAPVLLVMIAIIRPFLLVADGIARIFLILSGRSGRGGRSTVSWETVRLHLETGRAEGLVAESEDVLIRRISSLAAMDASSLTTPLDQLIIFPVTGDLSTLSEQFRVGGPDQVFIHGDTPDILLGVVMAEQLLSGNPGASVEELMQPLMQVSPHRPLLDLMEDLKGGHNRFALVQDMGSDAMGVVYLKTILRNLVIFRPLS